VNGRQYVPTAPTFAAAGMATPNTRRMFTAMISSRGAPEPALAYSPTHRPPGIALVAVACMAIASAAALPAPRTRGST
jgi:hypothetical protein